MGVTVGGRSGTLLAGLFALAFGLYNLLETQAFLARAVRRDAEVVWRTRSTVLVSFDESGRRRQVAVRRPLLSTPTAYRAGAPVTILYDPQQDPTALDPFLAIVVPHQVRVASWVHVWTRTVVGLGLAALFLAGWVLSLLGAGRFEVVTRVQLGRSDGGT